MTAEELAAVIEREAVRAGPHPQLDSLRPESAKYRYVRANLIDSTGTHLDVVIDALRANGILAPFLHPNGQIRFRTSPYGTSSLQLFQVASWCLAQARLRSARDVVSTLRSFVDRNAADVSQVLLLWGINPIRSFAIHDDVYLRPVNELTDSIAKDRFTGIPEVKYGGFAGGVACATGALTVTSTLTPVFLKVGERPDRDDVQSAEIRPIGREDELRAIARCLPLVTDTSVAHVASWFEMPADTPFGGGVTGWGGQAMEHAFHIKPPPQAIDEDWARQIVARFLSMSETDRRRMILPLDRLNAAMRGHLAGTAANEDVVALELGIALEALLTHPNEENAAIAYRIRQRGAALLGGSADDKRRTFTMLNKLYALRSSVAHGMRLAPQIRVDDEAVAVIDYLRKGNSLCAAIARQIIFRGGFPDWDGLLLGW